MSIRPLAPLWNGLHGDDRGAVPDGEPCQYLRSACHGAVLSRHQMLAAGWWLSCCRSCAWLVRVVRLWLCALCAVVGHGPGVQALSACACRGACFQHGCAVQEWWLGHTCPNRLAAWVEVAKWFSSALRVLHAPWQSPRFCGRVCLGGAPQGRCCCRCRRRGRLCMRSDGKTARQSGSGDSSRQSTLEAFHDKSLSSSGVVRPACCCVHGCQFEGRM